MSTASSLSAVAPSAASTLTTTTSVPSAASIIGGAGIGLGSTFPISQVLTGLMEVESIPLTQLQNQATGINTEISAYGTLSNALSTFQESVAPLTLPTDYEVYNATSSDTSVVNAAAVAGSQTGTYDLNVAQLAQAQTLLAAGQASLTTDLASSDTPTTVTFSFGTLDGSGDATSFTPNADQSSASITINSSDDTLSGLAQAINNADLGVTASIVNNGSLTPYQLVLTGTNTGADQAFQISVSGDASLTSLLSYPPSGSSSGLSLAASAQNADLTINGLALSSSTNTNTSLPGIVLQLQQTGTSTVTVSPNTSTIETNINNFVSAYNTLQSTLSSLTAYNPGGTNGALIGDPTTESLQTQLLQTLSESLTGTGGGLSSLAQVGITLSTDGTLSINDTTLTQQLQSNPSEFAGLFGTAGFATNTNVAYVSGSSATQAGSYNIDITQAATQGSAVGSLALGDSTTLSTSTALTVDVSGTTANITLAAGSYTSTQLAQALQNALNTNATFQNAGVSVNVSTTAAGDLSIESTTYGSASFVNVSGEGTSSLFGTVTSTAGLDVAGSIGSEAATGSGQTLTATAGPAAGLSVNVSGSETGALGQINYSLGFASQINSILTSATAASTGSIATATANLSTQISAIDTQETTLQQYIDQVQAQYQTEFTALDASLAQLQNTSTFLQETFNPTTSSS